MYAIIESGSKQYKVEEGRVIDIEHMEHKQKKIEFKNVLYVQTKETQQTGAPFLDDFSVVGEVIGEVKGPKVVSFKYKKRKSQKRKKGHRQGYLRVKITHIKEAKGKQ
jgi:large subunit ribosomal protein L21